ncbi:unnamed protein product [Clonostachys rhizophaga]|uniref:Uncharacterized protein n=1 Tax=Clonostachys rhizophaga TaxID=160324 RepID=A0A9N9VW56_9HYPO|nr:unnamed protein product [Clonostachys rhizophaga]
MPGALKSTACQTCKTRKSSHSPRLAMHLRDTNSNFSCVAPFQCDEEWPTCTQCIRRSLACPGPASLIKFVNRHHDEDQRRLPVENKASHGVGVLEPLRSKRHRPSEGTKNPAGADKALTKTFRFRTTARPNLTTTADRVGSRIFYHLDGKRDWGWVFSMHYLEDLPRRLSESTSLQHTAGLFCTVFGEYRRGEPAKEFVTLPAYGKALRSLRRAIAPGKTLTVETLASIMMLERTENVFNRGRDALCVTHSAAVADIVQQLGLPKSDDGLHRGLVTDSYGTMALYFMNKGRNNFITEDPWGELVANTMASFIESEELRPYFKQSLITYNEVFRSARDLILRCQMVRSGPQDAEASEQLIRDLAGTENALESAYSELLKKSSDLGLIHEKDDPGSIAGSTYRPSLVRVAQTMISSIGLRLNLLRMLYDCSVIHGADDVEFLFTRFRNLCVEAWKLIPFVQSLEACVASSSIAYLFPTLEVANAEEKFIDCLERETRWRKWPYISP